MTIDIRYELKELNGIEKEIKNINENKRKLVKKKKEIEKKILKYLEDNSKPGIKYNGTAVIAREKILRPRKKTKDKTHDCQQILNKYGINSQKVLDELFEAMKGDTKVTKEIMISNY